MLLGKRFRSLVVNTNEDDVEGDDGGHLHHASHAAHSSHAPHAAHAAGHACSTLGLLRDLSDDTLQQRSIFIKRWEVLVLPQQCTIEKQRLQRL